MLKSNSLLLGDLLVHNNAFTQKQLDRALSRQRNNKTKSIGEVLIDMKYITPYDLSEYLSFQETELNEFEP